MGITVANDAFNRSLSEHEPSLERQVKNLDAILQHLMERAARAEERAAAAEALTQRCLAASSSATARAELALETMPAKAQEAARAELREIAQAAEAIGGNGDGPPRHAGKRDRHGMHLVHGAGGGAAAFAALGALFRSPWARGTHRAVTLAALAAFGGAATVAGPSLLMPSPSQAPAAAVPAHHDRDQSAADIDLAPGAWAGHHARPPRRRRARATAHARPHASPGGTPPPTPLPSASPLPFPTPASTPPVPQPTPPLPTPPPCHGHSHHCQPAPAGYGLDSFTSSVLNPGPRLEAGRTVMAKHAATRARRVASGRASNRSRSRPVCVPSRRALAFPATSSRSSWSRASISWRRCRSTPMGIVSSGSAIISSVWARRSASPRNSPASLVCSGSRPGGFAGSPSLAKTRVITYSSSSSWDRCTLRQPGRTHPYPVRGLRDSIRICSGDPHGPQRAMPDSRYLRALVA